jgi:hypothetical protein
MMAASSLLFTLNFATLWWIPCGLIFLFIARTLGSDRDTLKKEMKDKAEALRATASSGMTTSP